MPRILYTRFVSLCLSLLLPQLVGVSWRLDYVVKSKHLDHVNRPLYILRFLCIARDGSEVLHTRERGGGAGGQADDSVLSSADSSDDRTVAVVCRQFCRSSEQSTVRASACTPLHGFRPPSRRRTPLPRASERV